MKQCSLGTIALGTLAACTGAGIPASSGGGNVTVEINLTLNAPERTPYGVSGGYAPPIATVAVGSHIRFMNTDSVTHTAALIPTATRFPEGSPFGLSALMQHGTTLSGGFSSGALRAGSSSQTITADRAGAYLLGCFFHYDARMRATIVAQ